MQPNRGIGIRGQIEPQTASYRTHLTGFAEGFASSSCWLCDSKKKHLGRTNIFRIPMLQLHFPWDNRIWGETTRKLDEVGRAGR